MNVDLSKYKIGLRTTKTALAVFVCLLGQFIFGNYVGLYACFAAVVCMRETTEQSWHMGFHRFFGTVIGGLLGFGLVLAAQHIPGYQEGLYVIVLPLGLVLCIWTCLLTGTKDGVIICCVVFIGIGLDPAMDQFSTLYNVLVRVADTTVGVVVAALVNRFVCPYKDEEEEKQQKQS